jgi:sugar-specific transcriptional regulator TrmB
MEFKFSVDALDLTKIIERLVEDEIEKVVHQYVYGDVEIGRAVRNKAKKMVSKTVNELLATEGFVETVREEVKKATITATLRGFRGSLLGE